MGENINFLINYCQTKIINQIINKMLEYYTDEPVNNFCENIFDFNLLKCNKFNF